MRDLVGGDGRSDICGRSVRSPCLGFTLSAILRDWVDSGFRGRHMSFGSAAGALISAWLGSRGITFPPNWITSSATASDAPVAFGAEPPPGLVKHPGSIKSATNDAVNALTLRQARWIPVLAPAGQFEVMRVPSFRRQSCTQTSPRV